MGTITIGVDLAKIVFRTCEVSASGRGLRRRDFKRDAFVVWLAQQPAGTVIAMEACSSAHAWVRRCLKYGLVPRLMAAQFVKPFRKSPVAKNDANDAEAIATAARQGNMPPASRPPARGGLNPINASPSARSRNKGLDPPGENLTNLADVTKRSGRSPDTDDTDE